MKTFKQHIKESGYEGDAMGVGTMDQNSIEDSALVLTTYRILMF